MQQGDDVSVRHLLKNVFFFTVKSMYSFLVSNVMKVSQLVWRLKILLKIKIFFVFFKEALFSLKITQQNATGMEIGHAVFVAKPETIHHLFFECSYAKFLWRAVHMILGINTPLHVLHLFNTCYAMSDNTFRSFFCQARHLFVGQSG